MRLQRYILNEARADAKIIEGVRKLYPKLYKDCKRYIEEWRKSKASNFMYRNVDKSIRDYDIFKSHVRGGRQPRDTPIDLHNYLNALFKKKFGWNVRNGVSTIGKHLLTYGSKYLFFPIGNYEYIYSTKVDDLYTSLESDGLLEIEVGEYMIDIFADEWDDKFGIGGDGGHWEYDGIELKSSDFEDALDELEADGIEAKASDLAWVPDVDQDDYIDKRMGEEENRIEDIIEGYIGLYTNKNLKTAIECHNEVLFNCDKYYLVNPKYEEYLMHIIHKGMHRSSKQLELFNLDDYYE